MREKRFLSEGKIIGARSDRQLVGTLSRFIRGIDKV